MTGDHFGLGTREGRLLGQHRLGDSAVELAPPPPEEQLVGGVLHESMVEDDDTRTVPLSLVGKT